MPIPDMWAQRQTMSVPFPCGMGDAIIEVEAKPNSSKTMAMMSFLEAGKQTRAPGCQKIFHLNSESLVLQASATSNFGMSVDWISDWIINLVVERAADFLIFNHRDLNEFVSMSVVKRLELSNAMKPTAIAILSAVRKTCVSVHIVSLSVKYSEGIGGANLSSEEVAGLWSRRAVVEVMSG